MHKLIIAAIKATSVQVASALVKLDAPKSMAMAVVPMGTANDFATSIDVGVVNDKVRLCPYIYLTAHEQFFASVL